MISPFSFSTAASVCILCNVIGTTALYAQNTEEPDYSGEEIVVIGADMRGAVITEVPPVIELSEADIASFGAS